MTDSAIIKLKPGDGGDGLVSFRREKYIPRGGPWGGDGGKGGDILVHINPSLNTLNNFHRQRMYKAENGHPGMTRLKTGQDGTNLTIEVPVGTLILDEKNDLIRDCVTPDETFVLFEGGRGGLGNDHFKSSTNRTPMKAIPGEKKEFTTVHLELKLLADIGIIGLPSAGKSTLINSLTRTNAKTAPYPFTTLEPNLGVLQISDYISNVTETLVLADIPGLIEGASEGKGLGYDFLKHIERSQALIHLIDGADAIADISMKPEEKAILNYNTVQNELQKWQTQLLTKPQIVVINKADLPEVQSAKDQIIKEFSKYGHPAPLFVSAAAKIGLRELVDELIKMSKSAKEKAEVSNDLKKTEKPIKRFTPENLPNRRILQS